MLSTNLSYKKILLLLITLMLSNKTQAAHSYIDKPLIHFISFAEGRFNPAGKRIYQQALDLGVFKSIKIHNFNTLQKEYPDFWNQHHQFMLTNKHGAGYWIWKSYIILKKLEQISDGDIVFYADAGCELNKNGIQRFNEYIDMVNKNDILTFYHRNIEKTWIKFDLVSYLDCLQKDNFLNSEQAVGGIVFFKKTSANLNFVKLWSDIASIYHLVDNSPSNLPNDPSFREHRHDQAIFSLLVKIHNKFRIPDESYSANWKDRQLMPVLARRNPNETSKLPEDFK